MDGQGRGLLRSLGLAAGVAVLTMTACSGKPSVPTAAAPVASVAVAARSGAPAASVPPGTTAAPSGPDLIVGGGGDVPAKDGPCSVSAWTGNEQFQSVTYGSHTGEPTPLSPGPPDRGACYLRMAVGGAANLDTITQGIDVAARGREIDAGGVTATLSGWFGGQAGAHYDYNVRFIDATGGLIDVLTAQAIELPTDPTALALSTTSMEVPQGTVELDVDLALNQDSDCTDCSSVAYADSLALVLSGR